MIQGEGGLMSLTGEPDGMPMKVGVALVDVMTGLYSCNAVLAALMARHQTNEGQHIDIALLDVQVATLANQGMNYLATGKDPQRLGNGHPNIVPYQTFATQDGSIILAIGNDNQFVKFCQVAHCLDLAQNALFTTNAQRVINRNKLIPLLASKLASHTTLWWIEQLESVAVPCGPVNTLEQVFDHPQIKHRQMVRQVANQQGELINTIASPINLSATPLQYNSASPDLGQHSHQVLSNLLNYSEDNISKLFANATVS
jgi:crotonobetainyl-CoA:carnitine CoA-transferase CaiB-like acyl-CoA transferase